MENYSELFKLVKSLPLEVKAKMVVGYTTWTTFPYEEKNIPSLRMSDGPNGIRKEEGKNGLVETIKSTCFPSLSTLACSFDKELLFNIGEALAKEARLNNVDFILGPGINIKRNPLCGRNFEYLSEDPFLAGTLATSYSKGIRSLDVGLTLKHFACNNTENYRFNGTSNVDERALREIYLTPFEMAIKEGDANGIMNSYNMVNGEHASENSHIMTDILRNEWNFEGIAMTDWGGVKDRVKALCASTDLEMPGMTPLNIKRIIDAINNKELDEEILNLSCIRILNAIKTCQKENTFTPQIYEDHYDLVVNAAIDSAVLLKNNGVLPLKKDKKYLVVGDLFKKLRYQGAGSSQINPYKLVNNEEAFKKNNISYEFFQGYFDYDIELKKQLDLTLKLIAKANEYDTILFFGGLTSLSESEGFDRDNLNIPYNQNVVIETLLKLKEEFNKEIIFISFGGAPYIIPRKDDFSAILHMALPGEGGGDALVKLLFGEANPSGHLSESWVKDMNDVPFMNEYHVSQVENYKESIYVGYRYYETINKDLLFPFGYGLSYTTFNYKDLLIDQDEDNLIIKFKIKNNGLYIGKSVPQIYIGKKDSKFFRPKYELKGYTKIELKPNEEKEVTILIKKEYLRVFFTDENRFIIEDGEYQIYLNESAKDIKLTGTINVKGEVVNPSYNEYIKEYYFEPTNLYKVSNEVFSKLLGYPLEEVKKVKRPYDMETRIQDMNSLPAKIIKNAMVKTLTKNYLKDIKNKTEDEKETLKVTVNFLSKGVIANTYRSLAYSSSGQLKENNARGMLEISNYHFIKAIKYFLKKEET